MNFRPRYRQVFYFIFGVLSGHISYSIIHVLVYFHNHNKDKDRFPVANMEKMIIMSFSSATLPTLSGLISDQKKDRNTLDTRIYYGEQPYLINTPGCRILNVKPFGQDTRLYWEKMKLLRPACTTPGFTVVENKVIHYTELAARSNITCCFKTVSRQQQDVNNYSMYADWLITFSKRCNQIPPKGRRLKSEFVQVRCSPRKASSLRQNTSSIIDYQVIVPPPETHSRSTKAKFKYWKSRLNTSNHRPPNVFILGIDVVSRLHMIRSLPKMRTFILENDFVEMVGYTKTGDNTLPNIMGLLGNMDADNYPCWRSRELKFDDCPLLWKNFSSHNYITGLTEDGPEIAIFNYAKIGFVEQPTDYYMRPLMVAAGFNAPPSAPGCLAGVTVTEFLINHIKKFIYQMAHSKVPYFLLSWLTELGHDNFNGIQTADDLFLKTLADLTQDPAYDPNNTVIIIMSDHGFRYDHSSFRNTFMGFFEESLPFFFIRVPPWFKLKYPMWITNLEQNRYKLTSPLDVHQTLLDILHLSSAEVNPEDTRFNTETEFKNTYSLFERIPDTRTCENSRIPAKYCMCGITPPKDIAGELSEQFARAIVSNLWAEVSTVQDRCVKYALSEILLAVRITDGISSFHENPTIINLTEYLITIKVKPGSALFETRIRQSENSTTLLKSSRINSYIGEAPHCIIYELQIKPFCFCKSWFTGKEEVEKYKW